MISGFRFYTMANDRMADSFERFLRYFSVFGRGSTLHVIPFDDSISRISAIIAARDDVTLTEPDPEVDRLGQTIFGAEEYRPGIKCWRYFRKLNAFAGHDKPFLFADVNSLLLADVRSLFAGIPLDGKCIYFGSRSVVDRTIGFEPDRQFLNRLNPGVGSGYNCGFFHSMGGTLDQHVASALARVRLRRIIGKAPEQGFLAYYIAICGLAHGTLSERLPDVAHTTSNTLLVDGMDGYLRVAAPHHQGRIKFGLKFTGQDITDEPAVVKQFLDRMSAGLSAVPAGRPIHERGLAAATFDLRQPKE